LYTAAEGGHLVDLEAPGGPQQHLPAFNSMVAFRISRWHEVKPVTGDRPRYSVSTKDDCLQHGAARQLKLLVFVWLCTVLLHAGSLQDAMAVCGGKDYPQQDCRSLMLCLLWLQVFGWFLEPGEVYELNTGQEAPQQQQQQQHDRAVLDAEQQQTQQQVAEPAVKQKRKKHGKIVKQQQQQEAAHPVTNTSAGLKKRKVQGV
jgi:hypothetical protein